MIPRDWLLLFISLHLPGRADIPPLDPVRIMKGLFLLNQRATLPANERYDFVPYLYGPCSRDIYRDLDTLVSGGLLAAEQPWGRSWSLYSPTARGRLEAERLQANVSPRAMDIMREIKNHIVSVPFGRLLQEVYRQYPEYATRSVFTPR